MSHDGESKEVAKIAQQITDLLAIFDQEAMIKALAHSHQVVDKIKRQSTLAGKSDSVTWEYELVQSDFAQMEQLFKSRAYDTIEQRAFFARVYTNVIKRDKPGEG